jgi:hypothetical protein
MTQTVTQLRPKPAKRPKARTVTFTVKEGEFVGWQATIRADFPASVLSDLQSSSIERILTALSRIVVDHNMPNDQDEIASSMDEVDPYDGLMVVAAGLFDELAKLPNR